jgi:hypothetical protein
LIDGLLRLKSDLPLRATLRAAGPAAAGRYDRRALAERMRLRLRALVRQHRPSA